MSEPKAAEVMTALDAKIDEHLDDNTAHADIRNDMETLSERVDTINQSAVWQAVT